MSISERIRQARKMAGLTQQQLADALGVAKTTISGYERGSNEPNSLRIHKLSQILGVSGDYLLELEELPAAQDMFSLPSNILPVETRRFPLLGNVACGEPIFADEMIGVYVDADASIHADFCLRASGDSMINARISDGDIVFIRQQDMVDDGEIAAVLIGDEATLKRVYYDRPNNIISLFAENPKYPTLRYSGPELDQIRILGKAVACLIGVK